MCVLCIAVIWRSSITGGILWNCYLSAIEKIGSEGKNEY